MTTIPDQLFFIPASAIKSPSKATVLTPSASTISTWLFPSEFNCSLIKELSSGHLRVWIGPKNEDLPP
ncbi:uncharacterized protein METZ01_LOCUS93757 [marine metagenome]|uniref:Uncharacterized protein n=1 Tax=marine metagenome TaxID=408172 RepID=A0A381VN41_9ZZZZ